MEREREPYLSTDILFRPFATVKTMAQLCGEIVVTAHVTVTDNFTSMQLYTPFFCFNPN